MPRKIRPKPPPPRAISIFDSIDYSAGTLEAISRSSKKTAYLNIYSQEFLDRICAGYEIEDAPLRSALWHCLEFNAVQYKDLSQRKQAKA